MPFCLRCLLRNEKDNRESISRAKNQSQEMRIFLVSSLFNKINAANDMHGMYYNNISKKKKTLGILSRCRS